MNIGTKTGAAILLVVTLWACALFLLIPPEDSPHAAITDPLALLFFVVCGMAMLAIPVAMLHAALAAGRRGRAITVVIAMILALTIDWFLAPVLCASAATPWLGLVPCALVVSVLCLTAGALHSAGAFIRRKWFKEAPNPAPEATR